ncbi:tol-pal system protein YbgF [Amaricoccus macauensis]|uniref:Cell division coordinator CpoB n=1 Tax=Amaricoccus macauensis TaxID=57001 RepID=A0A840SLG6_9RHOB|nr:tol-pal system protein YbgF [Amaricoccus macauensis]
MRLARIIGAVLLAGALALPGHAAESVADIRAQLTVLNDQIGQLREELVRRGSAGGLPSTPATALTRLDQLEAELKQLTDRVDVLTNDIQRIVADASNRVGDIEFRLTELEGGDPAAVPPGPTPQLGGGLTGPRPRPVAPELPADTGTMAVAEQSDFDAAVAAADGGDNAKAAALFASFLETYPGGPLTTDAQFRRGEALAATGDWRGAARSYLDAFSGAPQDENAPQALLKLAVSLGKLGQTSEACLTLAEVVNRYPDSGAAAEVAAERQALNCQ